MSCSNSSTLSSSLAWVPTEFTDLLAGEPIDIEEFMAYTREITSPEWWSSLSMLPGRLRMHLHHVIQYVIQMKRTRPGLSYQLALDSMTHSWAYGVAVLVSLFSVRDSTRALVLPCDQAVPVLGRHLVRMTVDPDHVRFFYFTRDGTLFRTCSWSYGHHRCH